MTMPQGNQNPGGPNQGGPKKPPETGSPNGGQVRQVAQAVSDGAEKVGERLKEGYGQARDGVVGGYRKAEGLIARNPGSSLLIGFGIGFGLGLVLTQLLTQEHETWTDRNVRKPLADLHLKEKAKSFAEAAKPYAEHAQTFAESIASHLPHSIRKHFV